MPGSGVLASEPFQGVTVGKVIQIRKCAEALHRLLKSRAALAGLSLSDYLLSEIERAAERPTLDELRARLNQRAAPRFRETPADNIRADRDAH